MKHRFNSVFSQDADGMDRTWTRDEDVRAIAKHARTEALKLLSVWAAVRLEDNSTDEIESCLLSLLGDDQEASTSGSKTWAESTVPSLLAASSWNGVAQEDTLLTPVDCEVVWSEFERAAEGIIHLATLAQKSSRWGNFSRPMWAIGAMVALGLISKVSLVVVRRSKRRSCLGSTTK